MQTIRTTSEKRRMAMRSLTRSMISYTLICGFLALVNWMTSPHYWWVLWVMAGWGIGIARPLLLHLLGYDDECDYR